MSSFALTILN